MHSITDTLPTCLFTLTTVTTSLSQYHPYHLFRDSNDNNKVVSRIGMDLPHHPHINPLAHTPHPRPPNRRHQQQQYATAPSHITTPPHPQTISFLLITVISSLQTLHRNNAHIRNNSRSSRLRRTHPHRFSTPKTLGPVRHGVRFGTCYF